MSLLRDAARGILRDDLVALQDGYRELADDHEFLKETMAELQLQLEDEGWMRLTGWGLDQFNRESLGKIAERSRVLYLKNPLIQRGANVKRLYVWGQGMSVEAKEPEINEVIQVFINDHRNKLELTGHQGRMMKEVELQMDGNLFFVLFVNRSTGQVRLASIPFSQIHDVKCNPDDAKEPWLYLREWIQKTDIVGARYDIPTDSPRKAYYADWRYRPTYKPIKIGDIEVRWEGLIYHIKVGAFSDWRFGVSEHYAAQDWSKAYKEFLEDWATITRAYARFAWKYSGAKRKGEIDSVKSQMGTTLGTTSGETNPAPGVGSFAIVREGRDLQPIRTAGATVSAEDGRRLLLMVAAAEGLPETFFGDVSVGTLATATSLDRPTELAMKDRQTLWSDIHSDVFDFVLLQAVKAPSGALRGLGTYRTEKINGQWEEWVEWKPDVDSTVKIDFPPLVHTNVKESIDAVVSASTLNGKPRAGTIPERQVSKLLLLYLGVTDDVDGMLDLLYPKGNEEGYTPAERALAEAAMVLRDELTGLIEKHGGNEDSPIS